MKKPAYWMYESLLVVNLLIIFFTKPIKFLPESKGITLFGFVLLLIAITLDIYWEMFWHKNSSGKRLVTKGIYKYVRHPFLSVLIISSFGLAITFNYFKSLVMAVVSTIVILAGSKKEEGFLIEKYGKKYKRYIEKVRFRFIPGIL